MKYIITLSLILIFGLDVEAQILGRVANRTMRKLERQMEDKLVEAISDEITRRAFKPVEEAVDEMLREKYKDSLGNQEEVDWERAGAAYADFLNGLNDAAELPEAFEFDVSMDIEVEDYDGKKNEMVMHFSKSSSILGFENLDDKNQHQLIVIDVEKDLVVLYTTDKKGQKTAQAIPSMIKLMSSMAASQVDENDLKMDINKTNQTKKVAGYKTTLYKGTTEEEFIEFYAAEDFPISWSKSFGPYMAQFAPATFSDNTAEIQGMVLQSENVKKDNPKKKSTWTTKKVTENTLKIVNADYEFKALAETE